MWPHSTQSGDIVRVKWLCGALRDLDLQMNYIAQDDLLLAQKVYAEIRNRVAELARHPYSGRLGRIPGTRELVLGNFPFLVPYRVQNDVIEILRIFHTSQKPPKSW